MDDYIIPATIMTADDLYSRDKLIFSLLFSNADGLGKVSITNYEIAGTINRNKSHVRVSMKNLTDKGYIANELIDNERVLTINQEKI